jgi:hypothetical protein
MRRDLLLILFLGATAPALGAGLPAMALSSGTASELSGIESDMSRSPTARRLLAQASGVERREAPRDAGGSAIRYVSGRGILAFDSKRLGLLTPWEVELALVRELARAGAGLPIELIESEMAAYQEALQFAMERAAADEDFDARLIGAVRGMEKREKAPRVSDDLPRDELDRIAYLLLLFQKDPDRFYRAVERGRVWPPEAVGLTELEDFLEKHQGVDLGADRSDEGSPYIRVGARRYRPALVAAARLLQRTGGLSRLREALGPFDSSAVAPLRAKINAWSRREAPP